MALVRSCRPGGDDQRERQLARAPCPQPQQAEGQLVGPLGIVEEQRQRSLFGQFDDQPPHRADHLVAARSGRAGLRQPAGEREHTQP